MDEEMERQLGLTSSKLPSSEAISRNNLAPWTSVEDIIVAIFLTLVQKLQPSSLSHFPAPNQINSFPNQTLPDDLAQSPTIMAPFVEVFPASELPFRTQLTLKGKARKDFHGDLKACELFSLWQFECEVERPVTRESVTRCYPVERLFRR